MTESAKPDPKTTDFVRQIGSKSRRKLNAQRSGTHGVWVGLGMMGVIGWSVVVPTLLGTTLGMWLDQHYPGQHPWTLALLVAGLSLGCWIAWVWVAKEEQAIRDQQENDHDL